MKIVKILKPVFCLLLSNSWAFKVTPMVESFDPTTAQGRSKTFIVENLRNQDIAVEVSAHTRKIDLNGKESREESQLFSLYPEQFTLKAKEKRAVRVTWTGADKVPSEEAFRIVFEQLPLEEKIKLGQGKSASINFRLNYVTSVYISPKSGEAKIEVVDSKRVDPTKLRLTVANRGTLHFIPEDHILVAKDKNNKNWPLEKTALKAFREDNLLAGSERNYDVAVPKDFPSGDLKFSLKASD